MNIQSLTEAGLRRTILDTSRQMLVTDGFNQLSMRKIAGEVGCSATSIYLYFDNKDALLHALIDEGFEMIYSLIRVKVKTDASAADQFQEICREFINFGLNNPEYYKIMFLIDPGNISRLPAEKFRKARRPVVMMIETLTEGRESGYFNIKDPELTAHVIWSSLHGAVTAILTNRMDVKIDQNLFIDLVINHAMRAITAEALVTDIKI
ncbi:MAG: TetR/AcrR family transcriptional regulator [Balneolales bacterium]